MDSKENIQENSHYTPNKNPIALFLDIDNINIQGKNGGEINNLITALKPWGSIQIRKAYASELSRKQYLYEQLLCHKFEISEIAKKRFPRKNSNDISIAVAIMDILYNRPGIRTFCIASGDSDFLSLIDRLHHHEKSVIGIGSRKNTSKELIHHCSAFLFFEDIIMKSKDETIRVCSQEIKSGMASMKTALRKRGLYPPDYQTRVKLLRIVYQIIKKTSHVLYGDFQHFMLEQSSKLGLSKSIIRNFLKNLVYTNLFLEQSDNPLKERKIRHLPDISLFLKEIHRLQISILLESEHLILDHSEISKVIWDDSEHVHEVKSLIESLKKNNRILKRRRKCNIYKKFSLLRIVSLHLSI